MPLLFFLSSSHASLPQAASLANRDGPPSTPSLKRPANWILWNPSLEKKPPIALLPTLFSSGEGFPQDASLPERSKEALLRRNTGCKDAGLGAEIRAYD